MLYFPGEAIENADDDYDEEGEEMRRKGAEKEFRKMTQTVTQRRSQTQQSGSSREAGSSTFCFHGKDESTSFDKLILSFLLLVACFYFCSLKLKCQIFKNCIE